MSKVINAVLCAGRHPIVWDGEKVTGSIWKESLESKHLHNHEWLERVAMGWLNTIPKQKVEIQLFVTGLSQALVAFLKMYDLVYMHRPNPPSLNLMFYDFDSDSYSKSVWSD
tara:strand:+ start:106 stop:441 length:336 start_codon:yes stop_codon:yes gene_type:complete